MTSQQAETRRNDTPPITELRPTILSPGALVPKMLKLYFEEHGRWMCFSAGICTSRGLFWDIVTCVSDLASLGHAHLFLNVEGTLGSPERSR